MFGTTRKTLGAAMVAVLVVYLGAVYWFQGKQCQSALDQKTAAAGLTDLERRDFAMKYFGPAIDREIATYCTPIPRLLW